MADTPRIDDLRRRLDREPGSRVFAQLAEELRKAGQLAEAIRVARQGLLVHPGYPSARMTLGRALMDLRDLRGARAEFEAVLRGATDNILASRFLGECLEGLGDLGSALLQYRATLRLAPGDRNLEAQIRALGLKLTPTVAADGPPAAPPASRPSVLPREGAIPVLEVDGPMELETSLDKGTAWHAVMSPPAAANVPAVPATEPPLAEPPEAAPIPPPAAALAGTADGSPAVEVEDRDPVEALVPANEPTRPDLADAHAPAVSLADLPSPSDAEPLNQSFPDEWEAPSAEPPALSSSTLAELYFNQGFTRQAIDVYKELLEREPGNERIAARIAELEALDRALEGGPVAPVLPVADPKALRRAAIERTITRLEGFLAAVRRP